MKQKALIYCRVSSDRQKNEGHGLESQEHRCLDYAKSKGYQVERSAFKDSFSGDGDFLLRPAMFELITYLKEHPTEKFVIIFDDLKRLSRDIVSYIALRRTLDDLEATVECPNFNFEDTPEGFFVQTVLVAQGQLERQQNRRQVIQKQKARLEAGYWPFGPIHGYISKRIPGHGKVLTVTEEAKLVKETLEGYASGRFTEKADIWRFLRESKFKGNKPVYMEAVNRLLDRRVMYAGFVEYPDWSVSRRKGQHEAIISVATLIQIEERLSGKTRSMNRQDLNPDFPARGFVSCGECKNPMTASWTTKPRKNYRRAFYRCTTKGCAKRNKSTSAEIVDQRLGDLLKSVTPKRQTVKLAKVILNEVWSKRVASWKERNNDCTIELKQIRSQIGEFLVRIPQAKSESVISEYEKEIEKLSHRETELVQVLENPQMERDFGTALDSVTSFLESPYVYWSNGGLHEKRLALKLVFSGKLPYHFESGFGTTEICSVLKVFEQIQAQKSQDVETDE